VRRVSGRQNLDPLARVGKMGRGCEEFVCDEALSWNRSWSIWSTRNRRRLVSQAAL